LFSYEARPRTTYIMPDQYHEPVKDNNLENALKPDRSSMQQEILELEQKLAEKKAEQEKSVEAALGLEKPQTISAQAPVKQVSAPPDPREVKADVKKFSSIDKSQQLQGLVNLAFEKGAAHATEVVKSLDNPYLLDEFHDILVDKFREELIKRGKLEEI